MKRHSSTIAALAVALITAGCVDGALVQPADPTSATVTTGAVTTGPVTTTPTGTSPITTSAVTTSPAGTGTLPDAALPLRGTRLRADVIEVFDGDSLEMRTNAGLVEVRLEGINAPERDECFGDTARDGLLELVDGPAIDLIVLDRDQFGRTLAYVLADGQVVNLAQIIAGNAIATAYDHDAASEFLDAEEEAFSNGRGLWGAAACGPEAIAARVAVARVEANPPGRDEDNLTGEWVGLVNDGDAVDLSGWVVRDESSTHRYTFADGTVFGAGEALVLRTGCGNDSAVEYFWCANGPVWSNGGDMVLVLDASGNVVDRYRYEG